MERTTLESVKSDLSTAHACLGEILTHMNSDPEKFVQEAREQISLDAGRIISICEDLIILAKKDI